MTEPKFGEWQPIETAPRDGTVISVATMVRWTRYKAGAPKWAQKLGGRWQYFDGFGWRNFDEKPDYWMPLPPPPEQEKGE